MVRTVVSVLMLYILATTLIVEDPYVYHTWNVTYESIFSLGVPQQAILINSLDLKSTDAPATTTSTSHSSSTSMFYQPSPFAVVEGVVLAGILLLTSHDLRRLQRLSTTAQPPRFSTSLPSLSVRRHRRYMVDRGSGLLLEVPSIPESAPAFVCQYC
ncbi:hypothetical protein PIB30_022906 [Stylosanthes scabra]|uniref:Uncharacterized protein n=1 Tax=Stylosanthes scabra TaxID=79078 RepID=A0ABU6Z6V9_9FABA|nr:hypothetical protein [Stylosanthes scabra]